MLPFQFQVYLILLPAAEAFFKFEKYDFFAFFKNGPTTASFLFIFVLFKQYLQKKL